MTEMLNPYRVEWRPHLTNRWSVIGTRATREEGGDLARETLESHGGYCRLISQHVIEESPRPGSWDAPPVSPARGRAAAEGLGEQ